jgi:hypothetical protein
MPAPQLDQSPHTPYGEGDPSSDSQQLQQSWAVDHARAERNHQAELAQVTSHQDHEGESGADSQQLHQIWAADHARDHRLHDSATAMEQHD